MKRVAYEEMVAQFTRVLEKARLHENLRKKAF